MAVRHLRDIVYVLCVLTEGQMGLMRGTSPPPRKYSLELRERAVRMHRCANPKPQIKKLAVVLGVHPESLRGWIRQAEADADASMTTGSPPTIAPNSPHYARRMPSSSGRTRSCGATRTSPTPGQPCAERVDVLPRAGAGKDLPSAL
ncbi:transposase [Streptomyces luteogriseus]|uniref:transposase n=1 Tax=Streptomyces luteogriseus TaxID=68233 RepID=UPI00381FFC02